MEGTTEVSVTYNWSTDYNDTEYYDYYFNVTSCNISLTTDQLHWCDRYNHFHSYMKIVNIFVVGVLIVIGLVGNTMAILVLRSDNVNKTVTFLLQSLAVIDNFYLLACIFIQPIKAITYTTDWIPGLKHVYLHCEVYAWLLASIAQTAAVWMVVLVTMDRYIAIKHPFQVTRLCTLPRAKIIVAVVIMLAIGYNIPRFFEKEVVELCDFCKRELRLFSTRTPLRNNKTYFIVYKTVLYTVFRVAFPFITLFILNFKLLVILKEATRNRANLTRSHVNQDSFTLILFSVVTVFLICEVPDVLVRLLVLIQHFVPDFLHTDAIVKSYVNVLTNLLLTVNSSVNCLIYCVTGRRFRLLLTRMLFRWCSRDKQLRARQFTQRRFEDTEGRRTRGWNDYPHTSNGQTTMLVACNDTSDALQESKI